MSIPVTGDQWLAAATVAAIMFIRFVLMLIEIEPINLVWCQRCDHQVPMGAEDDCCPFCKLVL